MAWNLDDHRPIYIQIVEEIQLRIVTGIYKPGERIPSVRELASEASVNPNTMQKAFAELERSGLIITQRTNGRIVTEDTDMIDKIRKELAKNHVENFFDRMKELGFTKQEIITLIEQTFERENDL